MMRFRPWHHPFVISLSGFFLPCLLLCITPHLAPLAAAITWGVYFVLQLIYHIVLAICKRDRALSPTTSYECGDKAAATCAVLVHGFADTPLAWTREAEALAARGWRVIVPEIDHDATATEWLETLHCAILEAKSTASHVEVWGHSMGGALSLATVQRDSVDRLVLWAPFLAPHMGTFTAKTLFLLHRLLFLGHETLTWFPINRHGKGSPETFYRVRRVISLRTFASALSVPKLALRAPTSVPITLLLSQHDTVVRNAPVLNRFPKARLLWAASARSSHALTNAADWEINLKRLLDEPDDTCNSL